MNTKIECKNIVDWIVNKLMDIVNIEGFKGRVNQLVSSEYEKGLEQAGKVLNMNFVSTDENVQFLTNYVQGNLQAGADQVGNELRQELSRGIMNDESITQLKKRVREVFKDDKYSNRFKTVLRTEKNRANNAGILEGAKQSGLNVVKYLDVVMDDVTSDICIAEHKKYGSPEKAIPLDQEFVVKVRNKTYRAKSPPFHTNCRTILRIKRVEE